MSWPTGRPTQWHNTVYDGFANRQSTSGPSLVLGAAAIGLVLVLASIFGLWLVRSVRRLNREVAHLNRQTEQLNQRVQGAEQHVKSLDQRASQASAAQAATIRPDQVPDQVKQPEATSAAQAQSPLEPEAAAQPPHSGRAQNRRKSHAARRRASEVETVPRANSRNAPAPQMEW